jgi:hypothetical protein
MSTWDDTYRHRYVVDPRFLPAFIHDFRTFNNSEPTSVRLNLIEGQPIDLLPLFQLGRDYPKLFVKTNLVAPDDAEQDICYKLWFNLHANEAWLLFINNEASRILYCLGADVPLSIFVKPSARKEWMPWDPRVDRMTCAQEHRGAAAIWRLRIGMGQFEMPYVAWDELVAEVRHSSVGSFVVWGEPSKQQ